MAILTSLISLLQATLPEQGGALSAVDWARAQFALTAIYHWLFVPLTLGLGLIMAIMETKYYRTGSEFWRRTTQFWQRLFGINFAMGVATGIILEFEFGTNWSNYSWFVGDIFGAPLAIEGIVAFFMESTFVAVMYFGWDKVSRGFHLASTWLTWLGASISAWWILVANSWMQYPVGCEFNPDTMRNEMTSFFDVALSPFAIDKFLHTTISSWIIGAAFVVAVAAWYLLKKREAEREMALKSLRIGAIVGLIASIGAAITGDESAYKVAEVQPMKLAAMEALYNGGTDVSLTGIAAINPFKQPNYKEEKEAPLRLSIPNGLSILATRSLHGFVPGVNDILNGYTKADGTGVSFAPASRIAADNRDLLNNGSANTLYAIWDEFFYVYHESSGAWEKVAKSSTASRETFTAEDFYYGGYGLIADAADDAPEGVRFNATTAEASGDPGFIWSRSTAQKSAAAFDRSTGELYFIKEVGSQFLPVPALVTTKDDYGHGVLTAMYVISATDTNIYRQGGVMIDNADRRGSFASSFTMSQNASGNSSSFTAATLFGLSPDNYLTVASAGDCLSDGSYVFQPYWITYDSVHVPGGSAKNKTVTVSGGGSTIG